MRLCLDDSATSSPSKFSLKMKPRNNVVPRVQKGKTVQGEGPNWILIAGGALLSTLSIRFGYKLKQTLGSKQHEDASTDLKGGRRSADRRRTPSCQMHSNVYDFAQDDDGCFNCDSGNGTITEMKPSHHDQLLSEPDMTLSMVAVSAPEYPKENGIAWVSSPDRLELPPRAFHHSNCSESPCVSESGSDIFSKREVIQKLRQQLKRRDDMIMEMQDQIVDLQNSLNAQMSISSNLQSQLDAANRDLFDSEREIQRLRKAIADHCVKNSANDDKLSTVSAWSSEAQNGHTNGFLLEDHSLHLSKKGKGENERIGMLKKEVGELKEVIDGKEFLLQSYKEQTAELSLKIKEMQNRLDLQLPNIL